MAMNLVLREKMPGEVIPSYLVSAYIGIVPAPQERHDLELAVHKWAVMSWAFPTGIRWVCRCLGKNEQEAQTFVNQGTLLPALSRLLPSGIAAQLASHHLSHSVDNISGICGMSYRKQPMLTAWRPALCPVCIIEDLLPDGEAYWRIEFILSDVTYCWRHKVPLLTVCSGRCVKPAIRHIPGPTLRCRCGQPRTKAIEVTTSSQEDIEIDFAAAWAEMLNVSALPALRYDEVVRLLQKQMKSLGILHDERIQWPIWRDFVAETPFATKLSHSGVLSGIHDKLCTIRDGELPQRPPQVALLLVALFGSWDKVVKALG